MSKPTVVISAPVETYSGYGARARDIVKALLATKKYDVKIISQRWGNTRYGYLEDHEEDEIKSLIIPAPINFQPDIWIQITVPNEFAKVGKYNIGITAGMETTVVHQSWIEGCNRMDLVLTSSKHSKAVFDQTAYDIKDQAGNPAGNLKLTTPCEVLFEGVDLTKYFAKKDTNIDLSAIKESFCFLFVGHWMQGDIGQDRKNVGYLVKSFLETFKNKRTAPALILKTQQVGSSIMDREAILDKIDSIRKTCKGSLPNIYLLHGEMSDEEINDLYNHTKVKAMVSFTKGEGYGRPLSEFGVVKKPIIASGWSGHVDFLGKETSMLVGGTLSQVHPSAVQKDMILANAQWFTPNDGEVAYAFEQVYKNYKNYVVPARQGTRNIIENFSFEKMVELLDNLLDKYLPEFPKQVALTLPNLNLPKLESVQAPPALNLPKLEKLS